MPEVTALSISRNRPRNSNFVASVDAGTTDGKAGTAARMAVAPAAKIENFGSHAWTKTKRKIVRGRRYGDFWNLVTHGGSSFLSHLTATKICLNLVFKSYVTFVP